MPVKQEQVTPNQLSHREQAFLSQLQIHGAGRGRQARIILQAFTVRLEVEGILVATMRRGYDKLTLMLSKAQTVGVGHLPKATIGQLIRYPKTGVFLSTTDPQLAVDSIAAHAERLLANRSVSAIPWPEKKKSTGKHGKK